MRLWKQIAGSSNDLKGAQMVSGNDDHHPWLDGLTGQLQTMQQTLAKHTESLDKLTGQQQNMQKTLDGCSH